jgi:CO/xanthine dehydrogenase FAD-binding subunit
MKIPEDKGRWYYPREWEEALDLTARYGAGGLPVAGATDILPELRGGRLPRVKAYIDLTGIAGLGKIALFPDHLRIGGAATHYRILSDPLVLAHAPLAAAASGAVGSPQVRNRGTIGGNLITLAACADTVPALLALDASLVFGRQGGSRTLSLEAYLGNTRERYVPGEELLREVRIPRPREAGWRYCFKKLARKEGAAKSRISLACALRLEEGVIAGARLAVGAVSPWALGCPEAEKLLLGAAPDSRLFKAAGEGIAARIREISGERPSFKYKLPVLVDLAARTLEELASGGECNG